ncbi:hypothetical protein AWB68_06536 [Caballeronia choica]|uniref:Uncharacterized protein n=1 Tax=Caballeronia choica TaxID=326476 RepID=A0A158KMW6_9BURK|nr:hypothetical protein AWB68_06536 [Caballeronia choica]
MSTPTTRIQGTLTLKRRVGTTNAPARSLVPGRTLEPAQPAALAPRAQRSQPFETRCLLRIEKTAGTPGPYYCAHIRANGAFIGRVAAQFP